MALDGGASIKSLLHDLVESLQHKLDKLTLGERKLYDFILVPKDRSFDFANRFPVLEDSGIYLLAPRIKAAAQDGEPEDWDKDGTLAGFSAGSEVAALRQFLQTATDGKGGERKRRGKARAKDGEKEALPPPPPNPRGKFGPVPLKEVESGDYLAEMLAVRSMSDCFHRHAPGAEKRMYWQKCPVTTRMAEGDDVDVGMLIEPLARAMKMAENDDRIGLEKLIAEERYEATMVDGEVSKKAVKGSSDLRRYTINLAPALARAMALLLEQGADKKVVRELMVDAAPLIAAEFQRVTGRKAIGVSVHFDSSLPHFNVWHSGLEPVVYKVGKSERTRFRRTAMNLNASGNMLAWDRVARAFDRAGEDFSAISAATAGELKKAEQRARARQGRPPGDFSLNRKADEVMESALVELGHGELIERGYREFVANERKRYDAGIAGRDSKDLRKIVDLLPQAPGETPLDAAQRLVAERTKIEETLASAPVACQAGDLASTIGNLVEAATVIDFAAKNVRDALQAGEAESTLAAAQRVVRDRDLIAEQLEMLMEFLKRVITAMPDFKKVFEVLREVAEKFGLPMLKGTAPKKAPVPKSEPEPTDDTPVGVVTPPSSASPKTKKDQIPPPPPGNI